MAAAPNSLFRIVFASRASPVCEADMDDALAHILASAIPRNREVGVTSLLLAHRGWFIQAIEGEEGAVRDTLAMMRRDDRHQAVAVLSEGPIETRMFDGWSLGARVLTKPDTAVLKGFDEAAAFSPAALPEKMIMRLLAVVSEAHHERFTAQQRMMPRR